MTPPRSPAPRRCHRPPGPEPGGGFFLINLASLAASKCSFSVQGFLPNKVKRSTRCGSSRPGRSVYARYVRILVDATILWRASRFTDGACVHDLSQLLLAYQWALRGQAKARIAEAETSLRELLGKLEWAAARSYRGLSKQWLG
jgi:hypothetical protein